MKGGQHRRAENPRAIEATDALASINAPADPQPGQKVLAMPERPCQKFDQRGMGCRLATDQGRTARRRRAASSRRLARASGGETTEVDAEFADPLSAPGARPSR